MRWRFLPSTAIERQLRAHDRLLGRVADRIVTTTYTADGEDDMLLVQTAGGAFTLTLPTVADELRGKLFTVVKIDASANNVTVAPPAGQTIDGGGSLIFNTQYSPRRLRAVQLSATPTYGYVSV